MALQPSLLPLVLVNANKANYHTLDIFLDYVCPFSAKMALAIENVVKPLVSQGGKYNGRVKVIFRPQVQPWHAASTWTHEAGLAVARVSPSDFWPFSLLLFKNQTAYFDIPVSNLTPLQVRESLATLADQAFKEGDSKGSAQLSASFRDLLKHKSSPNGGTDVTDDLKYTVKFSRQNGIHVSPTVLWDAIIANEISSSWGEKEWSDFFEKKITV